MIWVAQFLPRLRSQDRHPNKCPKSNANSSCYDPKHKSTALNSRQTHTVIVHSPKEVRMTNLITVQYFCISQDIMETYCKIAMSITINLQVTFEEWRHPCLEFTFHSVFKYISVLLVSGYIYHDIVLLLLIYISAWSATTQVNQLVEF